MANYAGPHTTLGDILLKPSKIPEEYYISPEDVLKPKGWKYLKGAKKEQREGTDGFTYSYNEGAMKFPDPLDNASRTIITGEGGSTPSRFKHAGRIPASEVKSGIIETSIVRCMQRVRNGIENEERTSGFVVLHRLNWND